MTDNGHIAMFVQWKEQLRLIQIKMTDDLKSIEKSVIDTYQLKQVNCLYRHQIQYYVANYESFIDLYSDTFTSFKQLLQTLSSPNSPPKSSKEWILRIVAKATETICHTLHQSITDDTYNYQQENDLTESLQNQGTLSITNNTQPPLLASRSRDDDPEDLPVISSSQNTDEEQQETTESDDQFSESVPDNHGLVITSRHPYSLVFDRPLAAHQRPQFESDINRGKSAKKKSVGGVFARAAPSLDATSSNTTTYPTVHFHIPPDKLYLNWLFYIYILTEADKNDIYYIHASKGIFDNSAKNEDKFGIIPNTELVNPYVVKLSLDDIRDGRYELRIKVCNVRNVCTHRRTQLREFPRLNGVLIHDDPALLSKKTSSDLNFASEKYHLGCILVCGQTADDRCISSLTAADNKRKRTSEDDANQEKKKH